MKTANQELEQLKKELNKMESKQVYAIKGGENCCGPGKSGSQIQE